MKKNNPSFVFFGATKFSKGLLLHLIENGFTPRAIFSIPEEFTITYNKKTVTVKNINYADLKEVAMQNAVPHYEVESSDEAKKLKNYEKVLQEINPDLILALGWYYMVPKSIRSIPKNGVWGIHASLLPKYAGGAPLVWAMIKGEKETGVSLFRFEDGVDDGDIIAQKKFSIDFQDTIKEVYDKALEASKELLSETFHRGLSSIIFRKQNKNEIEVFPQRTPEDGEIKWNNSALDIYNFIRAQTLPYPCAFTHYSNTKIKIVSSIPTNIPSHQYLPGKVCLLNNKALVSCSDYFLELQKIIISDGNIIDFDQWVFQNKSEDIILGKQ